VLRWDRPSGRCEEAHPASRGAPQTGQQVAPQSAKQVVDTTTGFVPNAAHNFSALASAIGVPNTGTTPVVSGPAQRGQPPAGQSTGGQIPGQQAPPGQAVSTPSPPQAPPPVGHPAPGQPQNNDSNQVSTLVTIAANAIAQQNSTELANQQANIEAAVGRLADQPMRTLSIEIEPPSPPSTGNDTASPGCCAARTYSSGR
jgi:hypothetical protein